MAFQIPLMLALALTGASAGANYIGARKADAARGDVLAAQRTRQKKLDDEAAGINRKAVERYDDYEGQQDEAASNLEQMYTAGADDFARPLTPASDSGITVSHAKAKSDKARAETDDLAARRARLNSFGDQMGTIGRATARDQTDLAGIFGFQRGNETPLAAELDAALQAGGGWRLAGDLLGGAGSIATMGALTGAQLPGLGGLGSLFRGSAAPMTAARPMARPEGLMRLFG